MKKRLLLTILTYATFQVTASTAGIPQGASHWVHAQEPDATGKANGRHAATLDVWLARKGEFICGFALQDYGLASWNKSPSGRFAGTIDGNSFTIRFNDSFSDLTDLGEARLLLEKSKLIIEETKSPAHGYLSLSGHHLQMTQKRMSSHSALGLTRCLESKAHQEQYLSGVE